MSHSFWNILIPAWSAKTLREVPPLLRNLVTLASSINGRRDWIHFIIAQIIWAILLEIGPIEGAVKQLREYEGFVPPFVDRAPSVVVLQR